jgi:hypothetical protein
MVWAWADLWNTQNAVLLTLLLPTSSSVEVSTFYYSLPSFPQSSKFVFFCVFFFSRFVIHRW